MSGAESGVNKEFPTTASSVVGASSMRKELFLNEQEQQKMFYVLGALVTILIATYWNTFVRDWRIWTNNPLYSHGYLVPAFAIVLMWMRREPLTRVSAGERWWGLVLLGTGLTLRLAGTRFYINPIDNISFIPSLAGVFLLVGGWRVLRWAGPGIGFLVFMFQLPSTVENTVLIKLQKLATITSTYVLQTLGVIAHREGSVINIGELRLNVVDACSGLRMLTIFVALAVAIVLVIERPWWDKLIILLSAVPIALVVNVIRVTVTGIFYMFAGESEWIQRFSHDGAGYFMMPLAMGLLYVEIQLLAQLAIVDESSSMVGVGAGATPPVGQQ